MLDLAIETAKIGGHIIHKAMDLHKKGVDTNILNAVHEAVKAAHEVIHTHWKQHGGRTDSEHV